MDELLDQVNAWIADDPDPAMRHELAALAQRATDGIDAADARADLADRFAGTLQFGTAGLRGEVGAGPNRMNRAVVIRAAAGMARWLRAHDGGAVVVGFDARHYSDVFARDTCAVMEAAGVEAMVLPRPLPTPVLAFALRYLGADAGVMVTASHNPPQDNGYKVYLADGSQLAPPADTEIAVQIDAVTSVSSVARADDGWVTLDDSIVDAYLDRAVSLLDPSGPRALSVVYTPLHGVGRDLLLDAFVRAGFAAPQVVASQAEPDPAFPTVAFPNPEEPGAIDAALDLAVESGADLVIANDPDADRCAVALPGRDGVWRMLTGDDVGVLLGRHLLKRGATGTFANSIVSSTLLGKVVTAAGQTHAETLTGFKWITKAPGLRFGYEEALGYCCDPEAVLDKDGVTAALLVCEMAADLYTQGRTLHDELDTIARSHGVHVTSQVSVRVVDLAVIEATMAGLRATPPLSLGGRDVIAVDDLLAPDGPLPPTDGLRLHLDGGARVIVRPSGTEPKVKCYVEVVVPVAGASDDDLGAARAAAATAMDRLRRDVEALLASPA
ncbi:MAG: phospho-sugar mutase [Jiangellales bacterium]